MNEITVPILVITFNRSESLKRIIEVLRTANVRKIYIACDAPRLGNNKDISQVKTVREIIENDFSWNCEIFKLYQIENQGCKYGPFKAIDWFFSLENEGIILEDDCIPHLDFFTYCQELLLKYRDDKRIMTISGDKSPIPKSVNFYGYSYGFSKFPLTWGWATWKRAWDTYNLELSSWSFIKSTGWLKGIFKDEDFYNGLHDAFEGIQKKKHNTVWDYQWTYNCFFNNGLSIIPSKNLITNIGFGEGSTHTSDKNNPRANIMSESIMPLVHPIHINNWNELDFFIVKKGIGVRKKLVIKKLLKRLFFFLRNNRIPYHKIK